MAKASTSTLLVLLATTLGSTPSLAQDRDASPRQNFVFFLVDDLGYMDIGANNEGCFYDTPNIDRLAAQGTRFTQAYAACQVCSPTRASIMSGKYPARMHTTDYFGAPQPGGLKKRKRYRRPLYPARYVPQLPLAEVTIAEALKEAGYRTFFAGKWHLGNTGFFPQQQGFDHNIGGHRGGGPYGGKKYFSPYGNPSMADGPDGEHLPARLGEETAKFIARNKDRPFFAYLSFYSVHTPLIGRPDLVEKYRQRAARLPKTEPRWRPEGRRKNRQVQDHAVYAAMVEAMDLAIGRVLRELEDQGLAGRTTVIFMSDNGGLSTSEGHPTCNLPLRAGKGWIYEGGIREPMIVRAPGVTKAGTVCDVPVTSTDFYPTILELAGLPLRPEQHMDGRSFVAQLREPGKAVAPRPLYWHYPHYGNQGGAPSGALRLGDYKLVEFYFSDRIELYDLSEDLGEQHDLAAKMPERRDAMLKQLRAWREEVGANMPTQR